MSSRPNRGYRGGGRGRGNMNDRLPQTPPPTATTPSPPTDVELATKSIDALNNKISLSQAFHTKGPYSDIEAGKYSDFRVKCFEKWFNLHSVVVCSHSPFFAAALKPGNFLESKNAEVFRPEEDPHIFSLLLQLFYLGELCPKSAAGVKLIEDVKLYVMADKYGGHEVKSAAFRRAKETFQRILNMLSECGGDAPLANRRWEIFTNSVQHMYSNLPSSVDILKQAVAQETASHWKSLPYSKINVKKFLAEVPQFAADVLSVRSNFEEKDEDAGAMGQRKARSNGN